MNIYKIISKYISFADIKGLKHLDNKLKTAKTYEDVVEMFKREDIVVGKTVSKLIEKEIKQSMEK